ncbi:MAG: DJ-1/PfpI family protein [Candidatus Brocadia sp.]|uniref:Intracellular proteinase I n=1 Tax=Candidatus Brocadia fulgida TaxID=380242 RepID=A0A0M2UWH6_9BACT|nr:MAG: intracellular proteinase I [Candidatus Brocadia fulgida]UJS19739.1 MAG: DJ-1/PfpI family protein [Candidatus Brocadia sp.]
MRNFLPGLVIAPFLLSGLFIDPIMGDSVMQSIKGKKAVMIIACNNFRDEELLQPKEVLEKNGVTVTVASSSLKESTGMLGAKVKPEILFTDIHASDYDAVIFVGGSGANEYWDNPIAHKIANDAHTAKKIVGAICIAPVTLAKAGLLKSKKATTYSSTVKEIQSAGANYTGADVERDGNIITASGPAAAQKFGETIAKALSQ